MALTRALINGYARSKNRSALSTPELAGGPGEAAVGITGKAIWDADQDCRFANQDSRFDRVCHVFHQEWFGIRAAAGSLPGHKLAISAAASWSSVDLKAIVERLEESGYPGGCRAWDVGRHAAVG